MDARQKRYHSEEEEERPPHMRSALDLPCDNPIATHDSSPIQHEKERNPITRHVEQHLVRPADEVSRRNGGCNVDGVLATDVASRGVVADSKLVHCGLLAIDGHGVTAIK